MRLSIIPEDSTVVVDGKGIQLGSMPSEVPDTVHALQWYDTEGRIEQKDGAPEITINTLPAWASLCVSEHNTAVDLIASQQQKELLEAPTPEEEARSIRDALLRETDWWALSDNTMTEDQAAYRQELRDITAQAGFPDNITWPQEPTT